MKRSWLCRGIQKALMPASSSRAGPVSNKALVMGPSGFVAVLAGWFTTEVGRQPFTVYGLMRTSESLSPVAAPAVGASLVAFVIVYFIVFGAGVFYLFRLFRRPPVMEVDHELDLGPTRAAGITPGPAQEDTIREGVNHGD